MCIRDRARVDQVIAGNAWGNHLDAAGRVPLLFREEVGPVRDEEPEVTRIRLVDAWVIDLVENSVRHREPHATPRADGRAHAALDARGPARFNARCPGRLTPGAPGI